MRVLSLLLVLPQLSAPSAKPVEYFANRIIFLPSEEKVILKGETRISYEEIMVEADSVEYDLNMKQVEAHGSPVLYDGDETIVGEFMSYNVGTGKGTVINAKTEISKGFFEGARISRVSEKILNVSSGRFTTCDLEQPHYYFKSSRMRIYVNDMVLCQPVVLYIRDIPVFAVPFWFFPIRKERHSGFLTPRFGRNSREGRYIKGISYYRVMNDYADATFTLDYMELMGFRLMAEGVYLVKPWITGGIVGSLLDDRSVGKRRWNLSLSHRQNWAEGYNLLLRGDFLSDCSYYREYSEDLPERMTRTLDSYVSFSKSFRKSSFSVIVQEKRDLEENTSRSVLPRVSYSLFPMELMNSAYLSYSGILVNRYTSGINSEQSLQNTVRLNTKQRLMGWLNFLPSVQHKETWERNERRNSSSSLRAGLNTNIYGISTRRMGRIQEVRHIITPSVNYNLSFKGKDVTEQLGFQIRNSVQLGLTNLGKYDFFTTTTSGSYDLRENKLSTIVSRIQINPVSPFDLSCSFGYDPYDRQVDYVNETFSTFLRKKDDEFHRFNLSLTQSYVGRREGDPELQIWGELAFNPTRNWFVSYRGRYDLIKKRGVSHFLKITRNLHCWVGELNVRSTRVNWEYDFKISIRAMPDISVKKGFFSLFLP